ncbi:MAG: pyruvate dehydrogenase complex dihydrolipoamide acetyltransferase [Myxococcota bacterium]
MAKIVGLPKLSPTMEEGTLSRWTVQEGDSVDVDDLLAEVETDKAVMEFRSFDRGVLLKILVPEGEIVALDAPVAIIGTKGEDISALLQQVAGGPATPSTASSPKSASPGTLDSSGALDSKASPPDSTAASGSSEARASSISAAGDKALSDPGDGQSKGSDRILASPLVRRLARERDVDLASISGTGPGGRIIKRDLEGYVATPSSSESSSSHISSSPHAASIASNLVDSAPRVEKLSSMRRTIARRLTESKQQVPHFYLTIEVDAEPLWQTRKQINASLDGEKVSLNDLVIKACAVALRRVPACNASFAGDAIHYHPNVDISVAVAVPEGLMTPVVRNADTKGALAISREVKDLAARAKERRLLPEEMTNGTFSISNLGMFGIDAFSAVINPPEGAILAVGTAREVPVVVDGALKPGRRMSMTLSCDHRVIDGAIGAGYLKVLRGLLECPLNMIL